MKRSANQVKSSKKHQEQLHLIEQPVSGDDAICEDNVVELQLEEDSVSLPPTADDGFQREPAACFMLGLPDQTADRNIAHSKTSHACLSPGCGKKFASQYSLKSHAMVHTGARPHACQWPSCDRTFSSVYRMSVHCRTHTGQRPYACTAAECHKAFKSSSDLRRHSRVHTGDKPYACTFRGCFKRFSTLDIRKVHLRTHTGERPYTCDFPNCSKSFPSQTNCKNHMRTHTGEKPFVCKHPGCDKGFAEYSTMYKHQLVHLQTTIVCDTCSKTFRYVWAYHSHREREHGLLPPEPAASPAKGGDAAVQSGCAQPIQLLLTELDVRTVEINGETAQVLVLPADHTPPEESGDASDLHLLDCTEVMHDGVPHELALDGDVSSDACPGQMPPPPHPTPARRPVPESEPKSRPEFVVSERDVESEPVVSEPEPEPEPEPDPGDTGLSVVVEDSMRAALVVSPLDASPAAPGRQ